MIEAMGPQALVAAVMSDVGLTGGPSARAEEDRAAAGFLVGRRSNTVSRCSCIEDRGCLLGGRDVDGK